MINLELSFDEAVAVAATLNFFSEVTVEAVVTGTFVVDWTDKSLEDKVTALLAVGNCDIVLDRLIAAMENASSDASDSL